MISFYLFHILPVMVIMAISRFDIRYLLIFKSPGLTKSAGLFGWIYQQLSKTFAIKFNLFPTQRYHKTISKLQLLIAMQNVTNGTLQRLSMKSSIPAIYRMTI